MHFTSAQIITGFSGTEILISPENPAPNTQVTATIKSFATNLQAAEIAWLINDIVIEKGIGKTEFTFNSGLLGSSIKVEAVVSGGDGVLLKENLIIQPVDIDLLWEANTYTPPFYKGRSKFTSGSKVTIVAEPNFINSNGLKVDKKNLVYNWYINDVAQQKKSGYGAFYINTPTTVLDDELVVRVEIQSRDNTLHGEKKISIEAQEPNFILYQEDPLVGILYNKALKDRGVYEAKETTLIAEPYFFDTVSKKSANLDYTWKINNTAIPNTEDEPYSIVLGIPDGNSLQTVIELQIEHTQQLLQEITKKIFLTFTGVTQSPFTTPLK